MKRNVYLAQPNHLYGRNAFLPYSAGMLQAYAQKISEIQEGYEFQPIIFRREEIQRILARMYGKPPDVLGLSCYIWNFEYNMALARGVKANFQNCLIVAGGPHIPVNDDGFFLRQPAVDIAINYEGERAFAEILKKMITGGVVTNDIVRGERAENLDELPSPYLTGVFDQILRENPELDFHASQETHRGCPYSCTFCDWGSAVFTKLRKFDDKRIYKELWWMVDHKIEMVYNCDANYGIFPRDLDLTKAMVGMNNSHGYPKKFRAAYAKNSNDTIFEHARILHKAGMNKGVTLSFQSMDEKTLETVKRDNIKITDFKRLMGKYKEAGIATYSEIILGLPGETYDSFASGLDTMLECGQHESLQVYTCEVLPNSEMNHTAYKREHEIKTVRSPIPMFHGTPAEDTYQEYYELITATKTLPPADWMRAQMLSWMIQTFHCLGLTQEIAIAFRRQLGVPYRKFYEILLGGIMVDGKGVLSSTLRQAIDDFEKLRSGKPWGEYNPFFGEIIWPPEEAAFLKLTNNKTDLYEELRWALAALPSIGESIESDLFKYQKALVPCSHGFDEVIECQWDWLAYFKGDGRLGPDQRKGKYKIRVPKVYHGDHEEFAREVVWYGRKGGSFKNKVSYA